MPNWEGVGILRDRENPFLPTFNAQNFRNKKLEGVFGENLE